MKKQTSYLKSEYVAFINKAPILFTAPHSKTLKRGGNEYD